MSSVKYNFVYRSGAVENSPVPSFYTCVGTSEITAPVDGDLAYCSATLEFKKYTNGSWSNLSNEDLELRVKILEFLVFIIIQKGFGGF